MVEQYFNGFLRGWIIQLFLNPVSHLLSPKPIMQ